MSKISCSMFAYAPPLSVREPARHPPTLPFRCDLNICFNTWSVPVMRASRGALHGGRGGGGGFEGCI